MDVPLNKAVFAPNILREKCPNMKFFWSVFSCIRTGYRKIRIRKTPYLDTHI